MTNNTDPVRALIAKWRRQAAEHGARTFTGNDHALFANELESALASAPQSAPVDEAMIEEANERAAIAAYEKHMGVSADDPAYGPDIAQWIAGWNAALAAQQQGGRDHG